MVFPEDDRTPQSPLYELSAATFSILSDAVVFQMMHYDPVTHSLSCDPGCLPTLGARSCKVHHGHYCQRSAFRDALSLRESTYSIEQAAKGKGASIRAVGS